MRHASGRPWLIGRWDGELRVVRSGTDALAVIGLTSATDVELRAALAAWDSSGEPVRLTRQWAGDFHVIASVGHRIWSRGTAYGTRRMFHTEYAGMTVASDRAAALARLTGAPIDRVGLATRLITPTPYPLGDRPLWTGVHPVRPGHHLVSAEGNAPRTVRWHRPPRAEIPLAEGATAVRAALERAVALRTGGVDRVSADLSGGLDSTSLVFLAARELDPQHLLVCTGSDNPENCDDLRWARTAAAHLPGVEHTVFSGADRPPFYEGLLDEQVAFDGPTELSMHRKRIFSALRGMAERGSRLHLNGLGGDHLFLGQAAHYHSPLPRHPLLWLRHIRGYRALFSWRWRELLPALADRSSFGDTMRAMDLANTDPITFNTVVLAWCYPPRVPSWITGTTRELVTEAVAGAADTPPLADNRGEHIELDATELVTREIPGWRDVARRHGVTFATPYFDDQVVDAARSVRLRDRSTPFAYKPLLAAAMRGVVPEEMTRRRTKATGEGALNAGLRQEREALASLWDDSVLGELGLVDTGELRRVSLSPLSEGTAENGLGDTVAAELWARSATPTGATPTPERSVRT
ncbi:asparagine synthase-related protein [Amycolatopsis antarctica]|uniref:asparagine synthase-related protein n=1 Tax=Amycolatopsis antarctica TaxID=1854586 RepID=UPI0010556D72|nr:asparagine synthase-related protein [Amycolatopsis antarctica]